MGKKSKGQRITKASIRQRGFSDGYQEAKNAGNAYITKLVKQGIGKDEIVEMILEYNVGYRIGVFARKDLNSIKIRDNKEYYNGKSIRDSIYINDEEIIEQAQMRKTSYKKRRR